MFPEDIEYKTGYTDGFLFTAAATYSSVGAAALNGALTKKYRLDFQARSKIYGNAEEYDAFIDAYNSYEQIGVNIWPV